MTKDEILQISNDISEGCCRATKKELIEVVNFWRDEIDRWRDLHQRRMYDVQNVLINHIAEPFPGARK